jgi:hypothetical protein
LAPHRLWVWPVRNELSRGVLIWTGVLWLILFVVGIPFMIWLWGSQ